MCDHNNNNTQSKSKSKSLFWSLIISTAAVIIIGFIIAPSSKNPINSFMIFVKNGFKTETTESVDPDDLSPDTTVLQTTQTNTSDSESLSSDTTSNILVPPEISNEEYFSDALFIGDSRTAGLYLYGKIPGAKYFARTSMTVTNCFSDKKSETGTGNDSLEQYLKKNKFGKIYILLGINEIGSSANSIASNYNKLITKIKALQPDSIIIVQSNMHVTKKKSDANPKTFNNNRIDTLNSKLASLADNDTVFYLSIESAFDDDSENMNPDYTGDGVHLKAKYYSLWREHIYKYGKFISPSINNTTSETQIKPEETTKVIDSILNVETTSKSTTDISTKETSTTITSAPQTTVVTTQPAETIIPASTTKGDGDPTDDEYFYDALFIGDSRTVGLYLYGRITGAKYFARTSMNVSNCFSDKKSETGTGNYNLEEYLTENSFGKIYILLGINEIGYSYSWITSRYEQLLNRIKELQPNAKIIIQSNMHVTKEKSDANPNTFNNTRINTLNNKLKELSDGITVFYAAFESIFDDEYGNLSSNYSSDGIHFKTKAYSIWKDWLEKYARY